MYLFANGTSGLEHRHFGNFGLRAPGLLRGARIYGASVLDVAPTVLHLLVCRRGVWFPAGDSRPSASGSIHVELSIPERGQRGTEIVVA
jgi:hypothetical protein